MSNRFTLSPSMLTEAFPFHFVTDRDLQVVQAGEVLQRLCSNTLIDSALYSHFQIYRPKVKTSYEAICKRKKSLFILKLLHNNMQLKGQFLCADGQDLLFFLGSPWITSIDNLAPLDIKLKDFAVHDPIVDFLFLLQAGQTSLNETKQIADELTQQQTELQKTLAIKEELAEIAESQAKRLGEALKDLQETQAQLIQTEKMSSLGQMVAGVAHEINNPVNFIHANLEYVKQYTEDLLQIVSLYREDSGRSSAQINECSERIDLDFLEKDLPQVVSSMSTGTQRIREIVRSLKTFSRLDESAHKVVDIHGGIDSTLMILKHRLKETDIAIHKEYGKIPEIECYAGQLNQVFMNLLSNAIDALDSDEQASEAQTIDKRSPAIRITTIPIEKEQILIKISDNGSGIPQEIQSRLFDPFFTTKAVGKGTGLGLSISYQIIVDKHGGKLWCESSSKTGATFYIQLPFVLPFDPEEKKLTGFKKSLLAPPCAEKVPTAKRG